MPDTNSYPSGGTVCTQREEMGEIYAYIFTSVQQDMMLGVSVNDFHADFHPNQ